MSVDGDAGFARKVPNTTLVSRPYDVQNRGFTDLLQKRVGQPLPRARSRARVS